MKVVLILITIILMGAISFLMTALAWWIICFAFGIGFSWKVMLGVWVLLLIFRSVASAVKSSGR